MEKAENKHYFSAKERKELAKEGEAMPNGSFPIRNKQDLHDAIKSWGLAKNKAEAKAWIIKRAKQLGEESILPEDWDVVKKSDTLCKKCVINKGGETVEIWVKQ
jgi:hypothetical protein